MRGFAEHLDADGETAVATIAIELIFLSQGAVFALFITVLGGLISLKPPKRPQKRVSQVIVALLTASVAALTFIDQRLFVLFGRHLDMFAKAQQALGKCVRGGSHRPKKTSNPSR